MMAGVSAWGTAGTGVAIAELSGAAATNATLAAIGGTVAAGPLVLVGIGITVAGLAGYILYKWIW